MKEFQRLLEITDTLLGPDGCPWDKKQTFFSLQTYLLEEMHELIEAIDLKDSEKISEELGDVFFTLVFLGKIAEREKQFELKEVMESVSQKLIRRHPHVFGDKKQTYEEVVENWERSKIKERGKEGRKSPGDGVPPSLPALARAQKVLYKIRSNGKKSKIKSEAELGEKLWALVQEAVDAGLDAESALRRTCTVYEKMPESGS